MTLDEPRNVGQLWDNRSAPGGAGNTTRGLTHSLDLTKEELPMNGTRICSVEDCDRPAKSRGWCSTHYKRWRRHGDLSDPAPLPDLCAVEGCARARHSRGWCVAHYSRWARTGDVHADAPVVEHNNDDPTGSIRLAERVWLDGECIRWGGSRTLKGYGVLWVDGKSAQAHRVAYELANGHIPAGLEIDHLCRVRDCVNPDHLEAVTPEENKRRIVPPVVLECHAGHPFDADNTYMWGGSRHCRACRSERSRRHAAVILTEPEETHD